MISYTPFWRTLKEKNITLYCLIEKKRINSNTINRIKKGKSITTYTLNKLCQAMDCELHDIVEYIPDSEENQDEG